jgi:phage-related protein
LDPDDLNVKREMRNVKCKINFTLNENPLSELADADGNVIGGLKLSIPDAGENSEIVKWRDSEIHVYPNPAQSILNIEIENQSSEPGTMSLELRNLQGVVVMKTEPETMVAGWHKHAVEVSRFMPGVYFLRTNVNGEILMRKVIITR